MATTFKVPTPDIFGPILTDLLEKNVGAKVTKTKFVPGPRFPATVAAFVAEGTRVAGLCVCDVAFASYIAAALTRVHLKVCAEAIKAGVLPDNLLENFTEIMNISSQVFYTPGAPRIALGSVHQMPPNPPTNIQMLLAKPPAEAHYDMTVESYGPGKLSFIAT